MEVLGERLDTDRRTLMLGRSWGLTTTYNYVNDPAERDPAVVHLREIHEAIDRATFTAYGWDDLDPDLGHHPTKIGIRWTISPAVRFEILDGLLAENHRRYEGQTDVKLRTRAMDETATCTAGGGTIGRSKPPVKRKQQRQEVFPRRAVAGSAGKR